MISRARTAGALLAAALAAASPVAAAMETGARADSLAAADSGRALTPPQRLLDRITLVGSPGRARTIPGSATFLGYDVLSFLNQAYDDLHRVLFRIPGVVVVEQDGYGTRPDVGMHAAGAPGSAGITLMEDGVPAAPAPYAAPTALDFQGVAGIEGVEVRKGSSQIAFGPRTVGGVLNLISDAPAEDLVANARVSTGTDDARAFHASYGDSWRGASWILGLHDSRSDGFKRLDGGGDTGFDVQDYSGKLRLRSAPGAERYQEVTGQLAHRTGTSHESALGLADADFAADPHRRYAASQIDNATTDSWRSLVRYFVEAGSNLDVTATIYRRDLDYEAARVDSAGGVPVGDIVRDPPSYPVEYSYLTGDSTSPADALAVRAGTRMFYAQGVDCTAGLRFDSGAWRNHVEVGARYHEDEEDRLQRTDGYRMAGGVMTRTSTGVDGGGGGGDNQVNSARAAAVFVQDRVTRGRLSVVPGVRVEWVETRRAQYAAADPTRSQPATTIEGSTTSWLPGIGATLRAGETVTAFAGVHRGFAPPAPGAGDAARATMSINAEAGVRWRATRLSLSAIGWLDDTDHLPGVDGAGSPTWDGSTRTAGLEASADYTYRSTYLSVRVSAAYTYAQAEFRSSFESTYAPWGAVDEGDELPYIPAHTASLSLGLETRKSFAGVMANAASAMRTAAGTGDAPDSQRTDSRVTLDITTEYELIRHARVFATVQNVTDTEYVASRFPAGARPGLPRVFAAGLKFEL